MTAAPITDITRALETDGLMVSCRSFVVAEGVCVRAAAGDCVIWALDPIMIQIEYEPDRR